MRKLSSLSMIGKNREADCPTIPLKKPQKKWLPEKTKSDLTATQFSV